MLEDAVTLLTHPKATLWFAAVLVIWALFMWISLRIRQIGPVRHALDEGLSTLDSSLNGHSIESFGNSSKLLSQNPVIGTAWSAYRNTIVSNGDDSMVCSVERAEQFFSPQQILPFHINLKQIRSTPLLVAGLAVVISLFGLMTALHGQLAGVESLDVETIRVALAGVLQAASTKFMALGVGLLVAILFSIEMRSSIDGLEGRLQAFTERLSQLIEYVPAETLLLEQLQRGGVGVKAKEREAVDLDGLTAKLTESLQEVLEQSAVRAETRHEQFANLMRDALLGGMKKMRLEEGDRLQAFQLHQDRLLERLEEGLSSTFRSAMLPLSEERGRESAAVIDAHPLSDGRNQQQERLLERIALGLEKGIQSFSEEFEQRDQQRDHLLERVREGVDQSADLVSKRMEKALDGQSERIEDQLKRVVNTLEDDGRQRVQQMDHLGRRLDEGAALRDEKLTQRFSTMSEHFEQQGKQQGEQLQQALSRVDEGLQGQASELAQQSVQIEAGLSQIHGGIQAQTEQLSQQGKQQGEQLQQALSRVDEGLQGQTTELAQQSAQIEAGLSQIHGGIQAQTEQLSQQGQQQGEQLQQALSRVDEGLQGQTTELAQQSVQIEAGLSQIHGGIQAQTEQLSQQGKQQGEQVHGDLHRLHRDILTQSEQLSQQSKQQSNQLQSGFDQLSQEISSQTQQLETGLDSLGERLEKGAEERAEQLLQFMRRGEWWRGEFLNQLKELLGDTGRRVVEGVRQELQGLKQASEHSVSALEQLKEALSRQDLTLLRSDLARGVQESQRVMENSTERLLHGMQNISGDLLRGQQGLGEKIALQGQSLSTENRETQRMVQDLNEDLELLPERLAVQMEPVLERVNQSLLKWQKRRDSQPEVSSDSSWQADAEQQIKDLIESQRQELTSGLAQVKEQLSAMAPMEGARFKSLSEQLERVMTLLASEKGGEVAGVSLEPVLAWVKEESGQLATQSRSQVDAAMQGFAELIQGQQQDLQTLTQQVGRGVEQMDRLASVGSLSLEQAESLFAQARSQWEGMLLESREVLRQGLRSLRDEAQTTPEGVLPSLQGLEQLLERTHQQLHERLSTLVVERLNSVARHDQAQLAEPAMLQLEQLQKSLLETMQRQQSEALARHEELMQSMEQVKRQKVDLEPVLDAVREQGERLSQRHGTLASMVDLVREELQGLTGRIGGLKLSEEMLQQAVASGFSQVTNKLPAALDMERMRQLINEELQGVMTDMPRGDLSQAVAAPISTVELEQSVRQTMEQIAQRTGERFEQDSAAIRRALERLERSSEALDERSSRLHTELLETLSQGQGQEQAQLEKSLRDALERGFRQLREQVEDESGRLRHTADGLVKRLEGWQQPEAVDLTPILEAIQSEGGQPQSLSSATLDGLLQGLRGELQGQLRESADKLAFLSGQVTQLSSGFESQLERLAPSLVAKVGGEMDSDTLQAFQQQLEQLGQKLSDSLSQRVEPGSDQLAALSERMDSLLSRVDQRMQGMSEADIRSLLEKQTAEANLAEMDQQQLQQIMEGMASAVQERLTGEAARLQSLSQTLESTLQTLKSKAENLDETFLDSALELLREEGERLSEGGVQAVTEAMGSLSEQMRLEVSRDASQMRQTAEKLEGVMGRMEKASRSLDGDALLKRLNAALKESGRIQLEAVKASASQLRKDLDKLFKQAVEKMALNSAGLSEEQLRSQLVDPVVSRLQSHNKELAQARDEALTQTVEQLGEKLANQMKQGLQPIQSALENLRETEGQGGDSGVVLEKLLTLADQVAELQESSEITMEELEALDQPFMQLAEFLHENAENMNQTHNAVVMLTEEFPLVLADMLGQMEDEFEEGPL
uniref:Uncharacterized protein n=1 Tax=Magnetococcus massalia (strain MO-1) TaxID=451514 RepID=A0A1S7LE87_MAGMO|nr:Conserved protein of unknown function [Candidatus Magnetococcus massalia]